MNTENKTQQPLYKVLNEKRTQGEMQSYSNVSDIKFPFQMVNKEDNGTVVCNFLSNIYDERKEWKEAKANSEYTTLAVNNLASIAEALESFIEWGKRDYAFHSTDLINELKKAKEALNRIS